MIFEFFVPGHSANPAQCRRRVRHLRHGAWRARPRDAQDAGRREPRHRRGPDGAGAARRIPFHRARARCRRAGHHGADGRERGAGARDRASRRAIRCRAGAAPPSASRTTTTSPAIPRDKMQEADRRNLVIAQIETERGLAAVEDIAAVEGIDCLWLGHFDLSNFLGIPGQFDNPTSMTRSSASSPPAEEPRQGARLHGVGCRPGAPIHAARLQHDRVGNGPGHC